jgi:hypothetical protein
MSDVTIIPAAPGTKVRVLSACSLSDLDKGFPEHGVDVDLGVEIYPVIAWKIDLDAKGSVFTGSPLESPCPAPVTPTGCIPRLGAEPGVRHFTTLIEPGADIPAVTDEMRERMVRSAVKGWFGLKASDVLLVKKDGPPDADGTRSYTVERRPRAG